MHLLRLRLVRQGPFDEIEVDFCEEGQPRLVTVIHGAGGVVVGPGRGLARYDVRALISLEDPTRGDLARETKQCLA